MVNPSKDPKNYFILIQKLPNYPCEITNTIFEPQTENKFIKKKKKIEEGKEKTVPESVRTLCYFLLVKFKQSSVH